MPQNGHRLAFGPEGKLWISSGERQKFDPSQDMNSNLGKILRLNDDGSVPQENPFADKGGVTAQIWSLGHRNPLGMAFDAQGRLWVHEMGPRGGDELNLIQKGGNYGYPEVSDGSHYSGSPIPDHDTRPEFIAPGYWKMGAVGGYWSCSPSIALALAWAGAARLTQVLNRLDFQLRFQRRLDLELTG